MVRISVFSDLNNLNDISMDEPYVELCGITEKEIHHYLEPEIRQLAKYQKMSYEDACRELKERYDGYHFTENSIGLYNPFSILNTFYKMKFGSYWFETGTPSYLVKLLLRDKYDLQQLAHDEATSDMLNCIMVLLEESSAGDLSEWLFDDKRVMMNVLISTAWDFPIGK